MSVFYGFPLAGQEQQGSITRPLSMGRIVVNIVIDQVDYVPRSASIRSATARNVQFLGVVPRKSDGFHCLSFRKPNSSKAYNVEVGLVLGIRMGGREWRKPNTNSFTWRERAAQLRSFIEQTEFTEADFD